MKHGALIFFVVMTFLFPMPSLASPLCACYFGEKNDCAAEAVNEDAKEVNCKAACETKYKTQLNTYQYNESALSATILFSCTQAHQFALEAKSKTNPVVPKLNVEIPGFEFSPIKEFGGNLHVNFLGEYIAGVYSYLITISTVAAVILLMVGGLQWSMGAMSPGQMAKGKERIKNAITGLVLLMSVVFILKMVNPRLVTFDPLQLRFIEELGPAEKDDPGDVAEEGSLADVPKPLQGQGGKFFDGVTICGSKNDCVKWCKENQNANEWPDYNKKTIDFSLTKSIPSSPGLVGRQGHRATDEMITALKKAGQIAVSKNSNYLIKAGGVRTLKQQIKLVCDKVKEAEATTDPEKAQKILNKIGKSVAFPGNSNHGNGVATDVQFYEGTKPLIEPSFATSSQNGPQWEKGAEELADIMAEAGFLRLNSEVWHFELEGKAGTNNRCKGSAQCPFPVK